MFVRKKRNKSGTVSIQIIDKSRGKYRVVKTIGVSSDPEQIAYLWQKAHAILPTLVGQVTLHFTQDSTKHFIAQLRDIKTNQIQVDGPERVFGKIFDDIGFGHIQQELFRHLVITRLIYPGSKLKTVDYLARYKGVKIDINKVYRFLDQLQGYHKEQVEHIAFTYTCKVLGEHPTVVFYDITTLYFEASDEDDLRKTGFSKDGKAQNPQILLGLLVGLSGYPIGYEIFEGNTFEGHTLLPVLEHFEAKFNLSKPIIIADAGLLSNANILALDQYGYPFILGGRVKNESDAIKSKIHACNFTDGHTIVIDKQNGLRLIVNYSERRAKKDQHNRERGLKRLEKQLKAGKLTKGHINNRGYNKYLNIEIDYEKFRNDSGWDGLKGYNTNTRLPGKQVIENYNQLWHIEKAFRISKTDLRIRPIYHRKRDRIEAHICIAFVAYTVYKEVERRLAVKKIPISPARVAELTKTMYTIAIQIPETGQWETIPFKWTQEQQLVERIL